MAGSVNGIGTTFYGQSEFDSDGSFVTTKWFVIGFLPLIPLSSTRVRGAGAELEVIDEVPLHRVQVLKTWAYAALLIGLVMAVMLNPQMGPLLQVVILGAVVFMPHTLRWFARRAASSS